MTAVTVGDPVIHHEHPDTIGRRWRTGVGLLIFADVAFVASLIFAYFYLRGLNTENAWFPKGSASTPIWIGWVIALGLVLSALAYRWGQLGMKSAVEGRLVAGTTLAVVILVIVTVGQIVQLWTFPFGVKSSAYGSSLYVLAGASAFHLLLTLFIALGLLNRARLGKYSPDNYWQVRLVGIWWNWVALAAIFTALTTSFVSSPNHLVG